MPRSNMAFTSLNGCDCETYGTLGIWPDSCGQSSMYSPASDLLYCVGGLQFTINIRSVRMETAAITK